MGYISLGVNTFGLPQGISEIFQRLDELESDNQRLREELATLKADNCELKQEIAVLKGDLKNLNEKQDASRWLLNERVDDVWSAVEENHKPEQPTKKATAHLDDLYSAMKRHNLRQITFREAGKLLGLHRQSVHRLKVLIATDERFMIVRDLHHKQRLQIRLKDFR